jgi:hypothetical protein
VRSIASSAASPGPWYSMMRFTAQPCPPPGETRSAAARRSVPCRTTTPPGRDMRVPRDSDDPERTRCYARALVTRPGRLTRSPVRGFLLRREGSRPIKYLGRRCINPR